MWETLACKTEISIILINNVSFTRFILLYILTDALW
jgi:hypothetical protein